MTYIHTLKRIRDKKTNYRKRSSLLLSKKNFVTIKFSNQNVLTQLIEPHLSGDRVIAYAHSSNLENLGWKGSLNSIPASYLTGLLLGKKASHDGFGEAVLYTGKDQYTQRTASCLKGIIDGGLKIPVSVDSFPSENRIRGEHISEYALLLKEDKDLYTTRFSSMIKRGLTPEEYKAHFEEIKNNILNSDLNINRKVEESKKIKNNLKRKQKEKTIETKEEAENQ
ncbi:MAG: 50S ribosomal protein L18 [Nitrososphaeraceae archaeon]|nr:50S ribosomal protein L18 [Nitrososphaeraceae archaeon]